MQIDSAILFLNHANLIRRELNGLYLLAFTFTEALIKN